MKKIIILSILILLLLPSSALAFNEDYIISDTELMDYNSMTLQDIKVFLKDRNSYLFYYADFYPETGIIMEAPEIIYRTAQRFKINPKFLLVLLEKEQSLVSLTLPSQKRLDWAVGYAVCDRCELNHPLVTKYKGFGKQIYYASDRIMNTYLPDLERYGNTQTGMGPGISKKLDYKYWVTPKNNATAVLYTYTPHIQGNKNFYVLWKRWFSNIKYPDGSILKNANGPEIYLIQNGAKRHFLSYGAFISRYGSNQIIEVGEHILDNYPDATPIKFADYSILSTPDNKLYMTVGDMVKPFESTDVFKKLGFQDFEIEDVESEDIALYEVGTPITLKSAYPTGGLLQNENGGVYWVYNGEKHPLVHPSLLKLFPKYSVIKSDEVTLADFIKSDPVKYGDGTLLKGSSPAVYLVSDGKLRLIPSEDIFLTYDWKWENVVITGDNVLSLYELGEPLGIEQHKKYPQLLISSN